MFNEVMIVAILLVIAVIVVLIPIGIALAAARAAERTVKARDGRRIDHVIAAVTSMAAVISLFILQPGVAFVLSVPLLVFLHGLERRSQQAAAEPPHAVARRAA